MSEITEFDVLVAEEAVLKKANAIHKERVERMKAEAVANGTPMRSKLFGLKVAGIDLVDGKPAERDVRYQLTDPQRAIDWMDETRPDTDSFAQDYLELFCEWWFVHTGELPDGFDAIEYETEEKPVTAKFLIRKREFVDVIINKMLETPQLAEPVRARLLADDAKMLGGADGN